MSRDLDDHDTLDIEDVRRTFRYIRASSSEQNIARQLPDGLHPADYPEGRIYEVNGEYLAIEKESGRTVGDRDVYREMCERVRLGDRIVFSELSRHARNLREVLAEVQALKKRGVTLEYVSEGITLDPSQSNPMQTAYFAIIGALVEAQADMQREAQAAGIARAKERDQSLPPEERAYRGTRSTFDAERAAELLARGNTRAEVAKIMGVSHMTLYRHREQIAEFGPKPG